MFLDDGVSDASCPVAEGEIFCKKDGIITSGKCRQTRITHFYNKTNNSREIQISRVYDNYTPLETYMKVAVPLDPNDRPVTLISVNEVRAEYVEGGSPENRAKRLEESSRNSWYFNENIRTVFVKVFDAAELRVKVTYE